MEMSRIENVKVLLLMALMVGIVGCSEDEEVVLSPQQALDKFYASKGAEDQLMDPLIMSGSRVVPLVLVEVENKDMVNRRYAIGALGNIKDRSALPVLEKIASDDSEEGYFRCDALNSIGMIDFDRAKAIAKANKGSSVHCLSKLSDEILAGEYDAWLSSNYMRRTLEDARSGKHY